MVDYRPLPMPGNEGLKSFSRVILKIGADYWAVERADPGRQTPPVVRAITGVSAQTLNAETSVCSL
jgi:hypothetical protein